MSSYAGGDRARIRELARAHRSAHWREILLQVIWYKNRTCAETPVSAVRDAHAYP